MPCSKSTEIVHVRNPAHHLPIVNGSAVQVIAHKQTVKVPVVDLRQLPEEEQPALVRRLATKEAIYTL